MVAGLGLKKIGKISSQQPDLLRFTLTPRNLQQNQDNASKKTCLAQGIARGVRYGFKNYSSDFTEQQASFLQT